MPPKPQPSREKVTLVLKPDQLDKTIRAFMLLKRGGLKQVDFTAQEGTKIEFLLSKV